jgi:hypothetical protein
MSTHNHYYRENDFNPEQSADNTLLVQVSSDSFSYAVAGNNKLLTIAENVNISELNNPTEENSLLSANYKQCIIGLPQNGFTFIPVSLFNSKRTADFARFLDVKENEKVFSQPFDSENQVIYKVDGSILTALTEKFDLRNPVFSAKGWIMALAANNPPDHDLYINIDKDKVELLNFKANQLRFYNSFEFANEDELVYFTSLVIDELQLQPQDITLVLSGDIDTGDKNFNRLTEFFQKVNLNNLKVLEVPEQISSHTILKLTALSICGSSEAR